MVNNFPFLLSPSFISCLLFSLVRCLRLFLSSRLLCLLCLLSPHAFSAFFFFSYLLCLHFSLITPSLPSSLYSSSLPFYSLLANSMPLFLFLFIFPHSPRFPRHLYFLLCSHCAASSLLSSRPFSVCSIVFLRSPSLIASNLISISFLLPSFSIHFRLNISVHSTDTSFNSNGVSLSWRHINFNPRKLKISLGLQNTTRCDQWRQSDLKSGGSWIRVKTFRFFQAISPKNRFLRQFPKKFDFFQVILQNFPGKNWLFTAISGQIILFLFKSHRFRTYSLYRHNNILRSVSDPHDRPHAILPATPTTPLPKIWGSQPPELRQD